MKFGPVPLEQAEGKILGHNVAGETDRRLLRKGKSLSLDDLEALRGIGRSVVYVAELEAGDVPENEAAERVARAALGAGLRLSGAATGLINLSASVLGLFRVDSERLKRLNESDGITLASVAAHAVVRPGQTVATVKVIPYAVTFGVVESAEAEARGGVPLLRVDELPRRRVGLILSGSPSAKAALTESFSPLVERIESLGAEVSDRDYVTLIVLAGETAIMDRHDITPRAVERAGGDVETVGAPVDPGNLLMLAYIGEIPVLGAPGCARSRKTNVVDWVLPRLLAADRLTREDIVALGAGGLLEDVPERPLPRSRIRN